MNIIEQVEQVAFNLEQLRMNVTFDLEQLRMNLERAEASIKELRASIHVENSVCGRFGEPQCDCCEVVRVVRNQLKEYPQ